MPFIHLSSQQDICPHNFCQYSICLAYMLMAPMQGNDVTQLQCCPFPGFCPLLASYNIQSKTVSDAFVDLSHSLFFLFRLSYYPNRIVMLICLFRMHVLYWHLLTDTQTLTDRHTDTYWLIKLIATYFTIQIFITYEGLIILVFTNIYIDIINEIYVRDKSALITI